MNKLLLTLFCFFAIAGNVYSQVLPQEGSALNYRLIGFAPFSSKQPASYNIEIASGNQSTDAAFKQNIIKTVSCKGARSVIEVPSFGANYTWRTVTTNGNKTTNGELHHFATLYSPDVDTTKTHLRIMTSATKYKDAMVCMDDNGVIYDMNGAPVWFLGNNFKGNGKSIRDLKLTSRGTITFMTVDGAYEINYDGDILWKAPNNGIVSGSMEENYHHELTRLSNGTYMVLGKELADAPASAMPTNLGTDANGVKLTPKMPFGTLIQYDKKGKVLWSWKSSKYYKESDLVNYKPSFGPGAADLHENAFFFDEKESVIYLSFKSISRIIKIRYPEGNVLNTFGEIYTPEMTTAQGNKLFCGQHACKYSQIGCLFLFNNNSCAPGGLPKIKQFREMNETNNSLQKLWEYDCPVEIDGKGKKDFFSGGNVSELPDRSLFVCMGGTYSKLFIVGMDKKVTWSAIPEKWNDEKKEWNSIGQYRASVIYDSKLVEKLVWSGEAKSENLLASERTWKK